MTDCTVGTFWWDTCHATMCVLDKGHRDLHYDGLRYFTAEGLQRPTEITGRRPGRGAKAGSRHKENTHG